jgi:hypothetical protein
MMVTGFIAFAQGWSGLYIRAQLAWKQLKKHPILGIANTCGIPDVPKRVHREDDLAKAVGTPEPVAPHPPVADTVSPMH